MAQNAQMTEEYVWCHCVVGKKLAFLAFFANFATIKKVFSENLSVHIILILDATFVLSA